MPAKTDSNSTAPANSNSAANSNPTVSSSTFDRDKYQELLAKGNEIEKLSLSVKLAPKPLIKGKVLFVKNTIAGSHKYDEGISDYRKAHTVEELETVIRVICTKGKLLGNYREVSYDAYRTAKAYGIDCVVSIIDYAARAVTAKKNFSNHKRPEVLSDVVGDEFLNPPPKAEITNYINSFQVDKILPSMTRTDEKELVRVPTTVALKPDAAIKGKIKIVQKIEGGVTSAVHTSINAFDRYNFPDGKFTDKPEELETLVRILCVKGSSIGTVEKSMQYSSKCEVSLVDYKTLKVIAQKIIENKTLDESPAAKSSSLGWIVRPPNQEIEDYLKSFPTL